jgi:hypothetical protein
VQHNGASTWQRSKQPHVSSAARSNKNNSRLADSANRWLTCLRQCVGECVGRHAKYSEHRDGMRTITPLIF